MSRPACSRHPGAGHIGAYCAACLFEAALSGGDEGPAAVGGFTIQVPLGESDAGSVFLVRAESPRPHLLRLKRWRTPAPAGFLERFIELRTQLERWRHPVIVKPVTAWLDAAGCAAVLTDFRRGMPLLDALSSRSLSADLAMSALRHLHGVVSAAHARGLAHGSLVAGNVLTAKSDGAPHLLDFGFAPLFSAGASMSSAAESDLQGLATIEAAVRALTSSTSDGV